MLTEDRCFNLYTFNCSFTSLLCIGEGFEVADIIIRHQQRWFPDLDHEQGLSL